MIDRPLLTWPLNEFLNRTASKEPTPGGGSVAFVSAASGCGLVIMACEVTLARKNCTEAQRSVLEPKVKDLRRVESELRKSAEADIAVFQAFGGAMSLPKGTDEEKSRRKEAMQKATVEATEVPLKGVRQILSALRLAQEVKAQIDRGILSDVGAGTLLLEGSGKAALLNVDINVSSLTDPKQRDLFLQERQALEAEITHVARGIHSAVIATLAAKPAS